MAKARVHITLDIEFDELQYENDGFLGVSDLIETFTNEFELSERNGSYDFTYEIKQATIAIDNYEIEALPSLD